MDELAELLHRIEINREIMAGKPVIKGTRITVEHIMRELVNGWTEKDLLDAHPRLTRDDIRAALAYATARLSAEQISIDAE
jgi:uncharacterized protein (DUF433 family)